MADFLNAFQIDVMNRKIGFPDYLSNFSAVDEEYERFEVSDGDYYKTKFNFFEVFQKDFLGRVFTKVNREKSVEFQNKLVFHKSNQKIWWRFVRLQKIISTREV